MKRVRFSSSLRNIENSISNIVRTAQRGVWVFSCSLRWPSPVFFYAHSSDPYLSLSFLRFPLTRPSSISRSLHSSRRSSLVFSLSASVSLSLSSFAATSSSRGLLSPPPPLFPPLPPPTSRVPLPQEFSFSTSSSSSCLGLSKLHHLLPVSEWRR